MIWIRDKPHRVTRAIFGYLVRRINTPNHQCALNQIDKLNQPDRDWIELLRNANRLTTMPPHSWSKTRATNTNSYCYNIRRSLPPTYRALLPAPRLAPPPPPFPLAGGTAASRGTRRRAKAPAIAQPFPLGRAPAKKGLGESDSVGREKTDAVVRGGRASSTLLTPAWRRKEGLQRYRPVGSWLQADRPV
jgi:hypothetical protein